jgi:hypothetical protein
VNCSSLTGIGGVDSTDALLVLRFRAGLSVTQNEPCPDMGTGQGGLFGDVDCSGIVNSVDSLKIQRAVANLSVDQPKGCTPIGLFPAEGT